MFEFAVDDDAPIRSETLRIFEMVGNLFFPRGGSKLRSSSERSQPWDLEEESLVQGPAFGDLVAVSLERLNWRFARIWEIHKLTTLDSQYLRSRGLG